MFYIIYAIIPIIVNIVDVIRDVTSVSGLEEMVAHPSFPTFMFYLTVFLIVFSISAISFILYRIIRPLAVFIMGMHAGYRHAWVAFLPYGTHFVEFALPMRDFNVLNWIKTDKRETVAWSYIAIDFFGPIIKFVISMIPLIGNLGGIIYAVAMNLMKWRKYYDLLCTFGFKKSAMTLSILSIFFKPLYVILLMIMCDHTPDYGWKSFENPILIDADTE